MKNLKVYTASEGVLDLLHDDDLRRLRLSDLVEGVSHLRRYCLQLPYTVLQHSLAAEKMASEYPAQDREAHRVLRARALMHDLSEGLLGDMAAPIRNQLPPGCTWERAHALIGRELGRRYLLTGPLTPHYAWWEDESIREIDSLLYVAEVLTLIPEEHRGGFPRPGIGLRMRGKFSAALRATSEMAALSREEAVERFYETLPKTF